MRIRIRFRGRGPRTGGPRSSFVVFSFVGHLLVVAAVLLFPSLRKRPPMPDPSIMVELIAQPAPRTTPPAPTPPAPVEPEPAPEPEPTESVTVQTTQPKITKKPPKPEAKARPRPDPRPATPAPAPAAAERLPEAEPGPVGGGFENVGAEFDWYRDAVLRALYRHWRQPMLTGLREPVEVGVAFEILRDGRTRNVRLESPSGIPSLDRSALRTVQEASLPPLPSSWLRMSEKAYFIFRLFPDDYEQR